MDYYSARDLLNGKQSRKLDRNTTLEQRAADCIAIRLHETDIVTFHPTYTELDSGGWHTMTTAKRMHDFGPVRMEARSIGWLAGGYVYFDGIRFNRKGKMSAKQPRKPKGYQPVKTVSGWSGSPRGRRYSEAFWGGPIASDKPVAVTTTIMRQPDIRACPHFIFNPSHYRADGTCKCNDPDDPNMSDWGYTWNAERGVWDA